MRIFASRWAHLPAHVTYALAVIWWALAVSILVGLGACSRNEATDDAVRRALRAAWRAYAVQATAPDEVDRLSESRFESEGRAAIASLDSARATLPSDQRADARWVSATLAGLVGALRDRHNAQLAVWRALHEGVPTWALVDHQLRDHGVAQAVAERAILRLAAWERRFLHQSYLADSYTGSLLALVDNSRVNGTPDTMLLHRPEIEARIAAWDSVVVVEVEAMK